jgi:hypothetical protein
MCLSLDDVCGGLAASMASVTVEALTSLGQRAFVPSVMRSIAWPATVRTASSLPLQRAALSIHRCASPSLGARSSAVFTISSGFSLPKGRVWSRGVVGACVWPVDRAGLALHVGEAVRVGAQTGDSNPVGCSISLPLPLRSRLPRRSGRAVVVGALCRRGDARNVVSVPERHRPVAFSVPDAGKNERAGSARIPFAGAESLSGMAWDNLLENKVFF